MNIIFSEFDMSRHQGFHRALELASIPIKEIGVMTDSIEISLRTTTLNGGAVSVLGPHERQVNIDKLAAAYCAKVCALLLVTSTESQNARSALAICDKIDDMFGAVAVRASLHEFILDLDIALAGVKMLTGMTRQKVLEYARALMTQ